MRTEMERDVSQAIAGTFIQRTQGSGEWDARAKTVLPGGDTRAATYYTPYPAYMERGEGYYLYDFDENRYIDFLNNYTSLIHGHAHPATARAVQEQMAKGIVLGSVSRVAVQHAELMCSRVPSVDIIRYCNSGTEATLLAMRAARAFTGKDIIIKMDGGYHGSHDYVQVNVQPDLESNGRPRPKLSSRGVPAAVLAGIRVVPFNDLEALEEVLHENRNEIAAVIMEPVLGAGGGVQPEPRYLQGVRQLTELYDVLLIFDEILTFRIHLGGIQSHFGVTPDLTTFGKIIAGGMPIGAFGGRAEIMAPFDPTHPQTIVHNGTFNGNNITMAAGLATMEAFDAEAIANINKLGQRLKEGFNQAFEAAGVRARATGLGSIIRVHWTTAKVKTARDAGLAKAQAAKLPRLLHLEMMNRGIYSAPRCQFAISTPMSTREIDTAIDVFGQALAAVRPYIVAHTPHLLSD